MIASTGVDIISTVRVHRLIRKYGARFLERWFTPQEIAYCSKKQNPYIHYAARLAAKEATMKALRIRWNHSMCLLDISVVNADSGEPSIILRRQALQVSTFLGITALHLSLSHCAEYAIASVIAEVTCNEEGGILHLKLPELPQ